MGLEALHILRRGEHPIFLYGQNYMGTAEAYLGALFMRFLGPSLVALRLGMLALFALFLVGVYLLGTMLYGRRVALVSLALLAFGSIDVIREQILAVGGVVETLVCGTFLCLLAFYLARTANAQRVEDAADTPRATWRRAAAYAGWGLAAGLGLWSHLLIVPFIVTSGALLLAFCRRDLRPGYLGALVLGLVVGATPLIAYNLNAAPGQNSLDVFLQIHQYQFPGAPTGLPLLLREVVGTVLWTVPMATGMSELWPITSVPLFGSPSQFSWSSLLIQGGWGVGYLALLVWATVVAARPLLAAWRQRRAASLLEAGASDQALVTHAARFLMLVAAWLTLLSFMFSEIAAERPWSERYLIGLLIATPAILWPLLRPLSPARGKRVAGLWRLGTLAAMFGVVIVGTAYIFTTVPAAQAQNAQEAALARDLTRAGITRIYSGYWVCDSLIFQSDERIICSVVETNLEPGLNRYSAYATIVAHSAHTAYVFPVGSDFTQAFPAYAPSGIANYQERTFDGYVVYITKSTASRGTTQRA